MQEPVVEIKEKPARQIFVYARANSPTIHMKQFLYNFDFKVIDEWIRSVCVNHFEIKRNYANLFIVSVKGDIMISPDGSTFNDYLELHSNEKQIELRIVQQQYAGPQFFPSPQQESPKERVVWFGKVPIPQGHIAGEVPHSTSWQLPRVHE